MLKIALTILFAASATVFATIGETEDQVASHYGKPVTDAQFDGQVKTVAYQVGDMVIVVKFEHGISSGEGFSKLDRSAISPEDIVVFLNANDGGQKFKFPAVTVAPGVLEWRTEDRKTRVAVYRAQEHALFITTQAFLDRAHR